VTQPPFKARGLKLARVAGVVDDLALERSHVRWSFRVEKIRSDAGARLTPIKLWIPQLFTPGNDATAWASWSFDTFT
jgi:hypothetical protein